MEEMSKVKELLKKADLLPATSIRVAATLRLADHITDGITTADALAERTKTHQVALERLLTYLATIDVLEEVGPQEYVLTELGELLRDDAEVGLRTAFDMDGMFGRGEMATVNIIHTVRTGKSAYQDLFGRDYWADLSADPVYKKSLDELSHPGIAWEAERVLKEYDWSEVGHVVDFGGNKGQLLIALLQENPHLRGTLAELPVFAELARGPIEEAGLAARCTTVEADFFAPLEVDADVYLLSAILADWDDESAVRILSNCADAARRSGGRILLADVNLSFDLPDPADQAAVQFRSMATVPSTDRTVAELKDLIARAGLTVTWEGEASSVRTLFELVPQERN